MISQDSLRKQTIFRSSFSRESEVKLPLRGEGGERGAKTKNVCFLRLQSRIYLQIHLLLKEVQFGRTLDVCQLPLTAFFDHSETRQQNYMKTED